MLLTNKSNSILKVTGFWILFLGLLIPVTAQSGASFPTHIHRFTFGIFGAAIALLVTGIFIKLEKKSFVEYNLFWTKDTLLKFFKGFVIGIACFSVITLILVLFAGLKLQRNPDVENPGAWVGFLFILILPAAFMEEIVFRSYPFLKLNKAFGLRLTQLIVSIIFALWHLFLGWSVQAAFLGPGIWAWIFGIAAIRSRGITFPTGIHVGLNLMVAILGMRSDVEPIFVSSQNESASNTMVNLTTRILVFLAGIVLTEGYIRRSK